MNILLVGSGGREHALAWKIAASPLTTGLVCAPGNPGMATLGEVEPVSATDAQGQAELARRMAADLVVIGPEAALAAGVADAMAAAGIPCFGPLRDAARLESSKAFTKAFCARHGIPNAAYGTFADAAAAKAFIATMAGEKVVVKADGLASGKGVVVAESHAEAKAAVDEMLAGRFGASGAEVVIEEFMPGEEASLFALTDGEHSVMFGVGQDHKRIFDGDEGPNTGGMGAYSPANVVTPEIAEFVRTRMISPTVRGLAAEGLTYRGVFYAGVMLTPDGPKLVEYNARFGDPETQVLMLRLQSDVVPYLLAAARGGLAELPPPVFSDDVAICVVLAVEGYPDAPKAGAVIEGAEADFGPDVTIFQASTTRGPGGELIAGPGRALNVCARAPTLQQARDQAYAAIAQIHFPGAHWRTDIGWRDLART
jgi:phosphoribosylamine--glycine ligase